MGTAAIIGAIAGLVTAVGGVAGLFVKRRRAAKASQSPPPSAPPNATDRT